MRRRSAGRILTMIENREAVADDPMWENARGCVSKGNVHVNIWSVCVRDADVVAMMPGSLDEAQRLQNLNYDRLQGSGRQRSRGGSMHGIALETCVIVVCITSTPARTRSAINLARGPNGRV